MQGIKSSAKDHPTHMREPTNHWPIGVDLSLDLGKWGRVKTNPTLSSKNIHLSFMSHKKGKMHWVNLVEKEKEVLEIFDV